MMVCLCHGVTERRVRREIEHGATTIEELAALAVAPVSVATAATPTLDALLEEQVATVAVPGRRLRLA